MSNAETTKQEKDKSKAAANAGGAKKEAPVKVIAPPTDLKQIDREKHFYVAKWCKNENGHLWIHGWFLDEERVLEAVEEDLPKGIKGKKAYDCSIFSLKSPGYAGRLVEGGEVNDDGDKPGEMYEVGVGKLLYVGLQYDLLEKIHNFNLDHSMVHGFWVRPTKKKPLKSGFKMMIWDVRPDGESKPRAEVSLISAQRRQLLGAGDSTLIPNMLPAKGESSESLPGFLGNVEEED